MKRLFTLGCIGVFHLAGCSATGSEHVFPEFQDVTDYEPGTVISAMPIKAVEPRYPREALLDCVGGVVEMVITVDAEGLAQEIDVIRAEPGKLFVGSASEAIFKWRFKTPTNAGEPVASLQRLPLEYAPPCE